MRKENGNNETELGEKREMAEKSKMRERLDGSEENGYRGVKNEGFLPSVSPSAKVRRNRGQGKGPLGRFKRYWPGVASRCGGSL